MSYFRSVPVLQFNEMTIPNNSYILASSINFVPGVLNLYIATLIEVILAKVQVLLIE